MDFRILTTTTSSLSKVSADALLIVVAGDPKQQGLDDPLDRALADAIAAGDLAFKAGRTLYLHRPVGVKAARVVFAVAGDAGPKAFKAAVAAGLGLIKPLGVKHLAVAATGAIEASHAEAAAAAASDATYSYRHTKPSASPAPVLQKITLLVDKAEAKAAQTGLSRGAAIAVGVALARECANRPGNHCTPSFLAAEARKLAKLPRIKVDVLDRKACEKLGMGSFLAVAQGSDEPPKFIVLRYDGATRSDAPVVLVGKGITFDTGGISIKPAAEMDEMKYDMGGAASVLGSFRALAELQPQVNVVGLIPSCENMPSGRAIKPGDVVTSMSGQTIEVLNTDAEGRLILCDALTYAERFKPAVVIDIATLTGACVIALGHHRSGLFSADDALADALLDAGSTGLDPAWRMPLDDEYEEALRSNFADMGNVGGRAGGAITAAMFLKKFTAKYRWAHLDIAGTAWKSGAAKGATGRPVPLLTHFVLSRTR
ncbi:leucyl aminopeptidase [Methylibium petroleiphilum]|uniref:leucyl aminopeptidase n=1 Tax=Methylibium petroleiphilum TaxID=105560 RepID=UPI001AD2891F|nr:leucyl aminopeptidase [Methylibium petroleiphilum]MBN9203761.1 leucyl aminopeptidase [Methylibium petroleiphilum]